MNERPIEPNCLAVVTWSIRAPELVGTEVFVVDRAPVGASTTEFGVYVLPGEWDCLVPGLDGYGVFHESQLTRIDGFEAASRAEELDELHTSLVLGIERRVEQ